MNIERRIGLNLCVSEQSIMFPVPYQVRNGRVILQVLYMVVWVFMSVCLGEPNFLRPLLCRYYIFSFSTFCLFSDCSTENDKDWSRLFKYSVKMEVFRRIVFLCQITTIKKRLRTLIDKRTPSEKTSHIRKPLMCSTYASIKDNTVF